MSTSRLADQRIRASASQVVGLDVRGPVSQALARAGVEVPPAPLADEVDETEPTPARTASRPRVPAARRVVKPFADAPWPTRTPKADPKAALSGLTADERRVHRILLDTLVLQSEHGYGNGTGVVGLSYAEKQKLTVLDLDFINAEIARMDRGADWSSATMRWLIGLGLAAMGLSAAGAAIVGEGGVAGALALSSLLLVLVFGVWATVGSSASVPASSPRRKIYDALRELALLADPDAVTSDALAQADAVIDRLAADDHKPRLSLDDQVPSSTTAASRARTRS